MRSLILGSLIASVTLVGCSDDAPSAQNANISKAGTVEEGVSVGETEIEELPVEEGAPPPVEDETLMTEEAKSSD